MRDRASFTDQFAFSEEYASDPTDCFGFLRKHFPAFKAVRRGTPEEDRKGCDYYIERANGLAALGFDLKLREGDTAEDWHTDDVLLETWSDVARRKPGWTRDESKACDYVVWVWKNTGRYFIVSFPALCSVFQRNREDWIGKYRTKPVDSVDLRTGAKWKGQVVAVPRHVLIGALNAWMSGYDRRKEKPNGTQVGIDNQSGGRAVGGAV